MPNGGGAYSARFLARWMVVHRRPLVDDGKGPAHQQWVLVVAGGVMVGVGSGSDLRTRVRLGVHQPTKKGKTWTGVVAQQEGGFGGGAARAMDCSSQRGVVSAAQ
jgi:hypothetical protein